MISWFQEQEIKILVRGFVPFLTQQGSCARAQSLPLQEQRESDTVVIQSEGEML